MPFSPVEEEEAEAATAQGGGFNFSGGGSGGGGGGRTPDIITTYNHMHSFISFEAAMERFRKMLRPFVVSLSRNVVSLCLCRVCVRVPVCVVGLFRGLFSRARPMTRLFVALRICNYLFRIQYRTPYKLFGFGI